MIDNKTINYITLPLLKAYSVSSVAISNQLEQLSKFLSDLSQKLLAKF